MIRNKEHGADENDGETRETAKPNENPNEESESIFTGQEVRNASMQTIE